MCLVRVKRLGRPGQGGASREKFYQILILSDLSVAWHWPNAYQASDLGVHSTWTRTAINSLSGSSLTKEHNAIVSDAILK